jgi:hypothetical protein
LTSVLQLQASHSLVTELSAVAAKESTLLNEYRELLATAASLQVQSWFFICFVVFISFVLVDLSRIQKKGMTFKLR